MANLKVNTVSGIGTEGTVFDGGLKFRDKNYLTLPKGTTAERTATNSGISTVIGAIRYNTDSNKMECYVNNKWMIVATSSPNLDGGTRGLWAGGDTPSNINTINFLTISTAGDATDFGDLATVKSSFCSASNSTIAAWAGGYGSLNAIQTNIFSSTGNSVDTADLQSNVIALSGMASETRGIFAGGGDPVRNQIQFYTFASAADTLDFGDASDTHFTGAGCASPTRGVFSFGFNPSGGRLNVLETVQIATTGNSVDFGDLTTPRNGTGALSNATRGIWGSGESPAQTNIMDYITIATSGNALDFGDMLTNRWNVSADGACSSTRGVWGGGANPSGRTNTMQYIQIATQGNGYDFGDLQFASNNLAACSNGHGGL